MLKTAFLGIYRYACHPEAAKDLHPIAPNSTRDEAALMPHSGDPSPHKTLQGFLWES